MLIPCDEQAPRVAIVNCFTETALRDLGDLLACGMNENTNAAKAGGLIARQARQQLENQTGKSVVSGENYLAPRPAKGVSKPSPRKN